MGTHFKQDGTPFVLAPKIKSEANEIRAQIEL